MLNKTRPLYGSFDFGKDLDIHVLIHRMQQVSSYFLEERIFNSYLKTHQGNSHYGLSYEELAELFQYHRGSIQTITSSSSTLQGKGVNINIRFAKGNPEGDGQFVIVAGNAEENEEIKEMLLGKWVEKAKPLASSPLEATEAVAAEAEPLPHEPPQTYVAHQSTFFFQHALSPDDLVDRIYDLFIRFMDDATFDIRLLTWSGDLHLGVKVEALRSNLSDLHGQVQKLILVLTSPDGRKVDLKLSFAPLALEADSEIRLSTPNNGEILAYLNEAFALNEEHISIRNQALKESFAFETAEFQIEKLIATIELILRDYLPKAQALAFISNKGGVFYHDVTLDQLKDLFYLYQQNIHVLSLYISRAITGQSLNLVFEFATQSGSLSLHTGVASLQKGISALMWDAMGLGHPSSATTPLPPQSPEVPQIEINPLFESKEISPNTQSCLLILPAAPIPEAGMMLEIQRALEAAGLEVEEAESIFGYLVMEKLWQKLNASGIVIADVTNKSAEVFYALGIAHTLGREVILLTQNPSDIPFDFKKYPHIIYEPNEAGYANLRQELLAYLKKT